MGDRPVLRTGHDKLCCAAAVDAINRHRQQPGRALRESPRIQAPSQLEEPLLAPLLAPRVLDSPPLPPVVLWQVLEPF